MAIAEAVPTRSDAVDVYEEETRRYERSPRDALRLAVFGLVTIFTLVLALWLQDSVLGFEQSVIQLFNFLSPTVERVINGGLEWFTALVGVALLAVPLTTKRYRLFWYVLLAAGLAALLMSGVVWLLEHHHPDELLNQIADRARITRIGTGSLQGCAALTAEFVVLGPFVSAKWRRAGTATLAVVVMLHLVVAAELPAASRWQCRSARRVGVAVLLAFGRPDRRPTLAAIRSALVGSGLPVTDVRAANVDARGSTPYFASLTDGGEVFVKVLGEDERAADLLFRSYRFLRLKDVGDYRPFSSLRRTVEHEALVSLFARDAGVRTPRMQGIVEVGVDSMLLAYDSIAGESVDRMDPPDITDELMAGIWQQVAILRDRRIAHRDLRRANVFVAADHQPWLIDFGFSELAVPDDILDTDVAQLLASLVVVAGPERTVHVAIDTIGRDAVADALPRLQINALSGATQEALKKQKGLLESLQREVASQCDIEHIQLQELHRFNKQMLLTIAVVVGATYFLFPQFADLPEIVDQVKQASWGWLPLILLMSVFTYVGAAMSLSGAVPNRLAFGPTFATQVGSSFASKLAPAGLGGMALNVRFMQKQGVDEPVALTRRGPQLGRRPHRAHVAHRGLRRVGGEEGVRQLQAARRPLVPDRRGHRARVHRHRDGDPVHPPALPAFVAAHPRPVGARPRRRGAPAEQARPPSRRVGPRDLDLPALAVLQHRGVRRRSAVRHGGCRVSRRLCRRRPRLRRPAASARWKRRSSEALSPPGSTTRSRCPRCSSSDWPRSGCRSCRAGCASAGCGAPSTSDPST